MPKLSALSRESLKEIAIPFEGGDSLNLTLDGARFTIGFFKRLKAIPDDDIPTFAEAFFSLVKDWDLTDDEGEKLPLDSSTIEAFRIDTFMAIVTKIQESQSPSPATSI